MQNRNERKEKEQADSHPSYFHLSNLVRTRRIELPLPRGNRLLRPARLPVPPRPHIRTSDNTYSSVEIQEAAWICYI